MTPGDEEKVSLGNCVVHPLNFVGPASLLSYEDIPLFTIAYFLLLNKWQVDQTQQSKTAKSMMKTRGVKKTVSSNFLHSMRERSVVEKAEDQMEVIH